MTLQPCGTPAALRRHYLHGEKPCAACRAARTVYKRTLRAGRSAANDIRLAYRIKTAHPDVLAGAVVQLLTGPGISDHVRGVVSTTLLQHLDMTATRPTPPEEPT